METANSLANTILLIETSDIVFNTFQLEKFEANSFPKIQGKSKIQSSQPRKKKRFNKSLWTLQENIKYIQFLQQNREMFQSTKENRRLLKINKMISLCIKTRSADQCRSHHQKMIKYHESLEGIISHVLLLQNMFVQDVKKKDEKQVKAPLRIRKRVSKDQPISPAVTVDEESEGGLWDVLYSNQFDFMCSEEDI